MKLDINNLDILRNRYNLKSYIQKLVQVDIPKISTKHEETHMKNIGERPIRARQRGDEENKTKSRNQIKCNKPFLDYKLENEASSPRDNLC